MTQVVPTKVGYYRVGQVEVCVTRFFYILSNDKGILSFPRNEVSDLLTLLQVLQGDGSTEAKAPQAAPSSAVVPGALASAKPDAEAKSWWQKRGELWKRVREYLAKSDRAKSQNAILRAICNSAMERDEVHHALTVTVGRRIKSGALIETRSGRLRLP